MSTPIHAVHRAAPRASLPPFGPETAGTVRRFHSSFPEYRPTPLASLSRLAGALGLGALYVKDESQRFGLNAFKVLGGSWAIARCIGQRLQISPEELSFDLLTRPSVRKALGELTFVTATDGNHGRGVAWTAARLGMRSVVYMPRGTARERLDNILALGSEASITGLLYDDAVRLAAKQAQERSWILVQDTSWPGYDQIPAWIMEGYTTLALETAEQLEGVRPTHILLQAGVGSMAGAVAGFFASLWGTECPAVIVVEPHQADCLFRTAQAGDGQLHSAAGELDTIMAGLACGEPCGVAWTVLENWGEHFLSVSDTLSAKGMRILGSPLPGDPQIISGESGAVTAGVTAALMTDPALSPLRERLDLGPSSRVLCVSTEGDTDRANYRKIVWDGLHPSL